MSFIKKSAVFLILIFSFFAKGLFAQESDAPDLSLKEIDLFIKQTDYDSALKALSAYIKKFPQDLDAAQRRVDKIMNARLYYSHLANELLDVLEKEPENAEKKLAIIRQLESLEKNPSEERLAFIREAKAAAEFTYYRAQFRRIMEDAARYSRQEKFEEAVALIQTGFYMYRDEFYEENTPAVTLSVTKSVEGLSSAAKKYLDGRKSLLLSLSDFLKAVDSGVWQNADREKKGFFSEMEKFSKSRSALIEAGQEIQNMFARLQKADPSLTEASYLPFMSHFALGSESIKDSGILGTMDFEWSLIMEGARNSLYSAIEKKFSSFLKTAPKEKFDEKDFLPDSAFLADAKKFADLSLEVFALDGLRKNASSFGLARYNEEVDDAKNLSLGTTSSLENFLQIKKISSQLDGLLLPDGSGQPEKVLSLLNELSECKKKASTALSAPWFLGHRNAPPSQAFFDQYDFYESLNTHSSEVAVSSESGGWKSLSSYYASEAGTIVGGPEGDLAEASSLMDAHMPKEASEKAASALSSAKSGRGRLLSMRATLQNAPEGIFSSDGDFVSTSLLALEGYEKTGNEILLKAQSETLLAQSAKSRADEIYRTAVRNFRSENFSAARSNLQRARELYNESLSHQESESVRADSDKNLGNLGREINDAENRIIVTEVRGLKTRAKNEFYAGNFEGAENYLNRAESRWAVTNVEPDMEIQNLKLLVQNALSMKTGREIKPTAPLYPEMSQILSNAHQYFDQGSTLMKSGNREKALSYLEGAKKKLQELQIVYPLNKEAALLSLRIDELSDPERFNDIFASRFQAARQNVAVPSTRQQAYSDLLDLAEIRPNYPGLSKAIYDVEIELGIRQKPVDQSGRRRSAALEKEARDLYARANGNEEILREALSRLDQAILLNGENESAIMLKDRIQIAVGGKAAVVLSSVDEASYNRAIQELRNNNVLGAYTIVEQLLQTPQNRRSSKILDLQKQVQARM